MQENLTDENNDSIIYSNLTTKSQDCQCGCYWIMSFNGTYVDDETSCTKGGQSAVLLYDGGTYYRCETYESLCDCQNPTPPDYGQYQSVLSPNVQDQPVSGVCVKHYFSFSSSKESCVTYYIQPYGTDEDGNPIYQIPNGGFTSSPPTAEADAYCERCININTGAEC